MQRTTPTLAIAIGLFTAVPTHAQVAQLSCNGVINGWESRLEGKRIFQPTNAYGDGYVQFRGQLRSNRGSTPIAWEGHSNLAPFQGVLRTSDGDYVIGVLDATGSDGSQLIIYDGRASLGPPTVLGQYRCRWR